MSKFIQKIKQRYLCFVLISFILPMLAASGQKINPYLEYYSNQPLNERINSTENAVHSSFKPILNLGNQFIESIDSAKFLHRDLNFPEKTKKTWFYRKIRKEDLVNIDSRNLHFQLNPLFNFELKKDNLNTENMFCNTRGIELKGEIGQSIYFYTSFYENQARFEPYVTDYVNEYIVVPGQGAPKFKENNVLDFAMASAFIHINPFKFMNIQFGQSKHFIGEGYRSLILSDNTYNYPFFRIATVFGQFQYSLFWSRNELFSGAYYNYHQRKYNALSQLSWKPGRVFEISVFESIQWPGDTPEQKNFTIGLFNPLIFWRTIQYGLNNNHNIMIGLNSKIKLYNFSQFYAQFALDRVDFQQKANNNFAIQAGIKHFDLFHNQNRQQKLFIQYEFNYIAPYTYSFSDPKMSFTHYNQPVTHPSGTGLKESLVILSYSYKDFNLRIYSSYLINSLDTANTNYGSDVFKPDALYPDVESHIGNTPGQGIKNTRIKINTEFIFLINPAYNLQIFTQFSHRKNQNSIAGNEYWVFSFGLRTNLNNYYYDF